MALIFKFDSQQLQTIVKAIDKGFADLVETLGGTPSEEAQERINEIAGRVKAVKDKLQTSIDANKGD